MKKIAKNIIINDAFFQFEDSNGNENKIRWDDIVKVIIETNDLGPFEEDVYFILFTLKDEIIFPQGLDGLLAMIEYLQSFLPNFNNHELIRAMSSTSNMSFEIWCSNIERGRDTGCDRSGQN